MNFLKGGSRGLILNVLRFAFEMECYAYPRAGECLTNQQPAQVKKC